MDISAYDLRVFETVADEGNITRGASRLGLTQPAVTRSLQKLEEELGSELFVRSRKGVTLTRAGKKVRASTRRLLSGFEEVRDLLRNEAQDLSGTYSIGVHADLASHTLHKFVAPLLCEYRNLEFRFVHDLSREINRRVVTLEIDFGIVVNPIRYPDLTIHKLYFDEVGFWVRKGTRPSSVLNQEGTPILCHPGLTQVRKLLKQVSRKGVFPKHRLIYTSNLQLIADLTATCAGVGIIPSTTARLHNESRLRCIPDTPVHKDTICLVYRRDVLRGTAGHAIKDKILQSLAE